jgi:UMF1 family MFS transporter
VKQPPFFFTFDVMLNNPKTIRGWAMYDWANSVFNLVITTAIFPQFFEGVTKNAAQNTGRIESVFENGVETKLHYIHVFGFEFLNTALYSYCGTAFYLLVAILAPLFSGLADISGTKKKFMQFYVVLGAVSVMSLYFFDAQHIEWGVIGFVLAGVGWGGSLVYYNAFLPEIATPDQYDRVSAKGFSYGYIGSVILLVIILVLILQPSLFFNVEEYRATLNGNLSKEELDALVKSHFAGIGSRIGFLMTGLWWFGFSIITFKTLPQEVKTEKAGLGHLGRGFSELKKVLQYALKTRNLSFFIFGFFMLSMGLQTVMFVATLFGKNELHLETGKLIMTVLLIQLVAIGGAYIFSKASKKFGDIPALKVGVLLWIGICVGAYFLKTDIQFYALAFAVGLIMGGIQSLSRATFARFIPQENHDNASFFSLYEFTEKIGIVLGTFAFGLVNEITGSMRISTLMLAGFFVASFVLFSMIQRIRNGETVKG